MTAPNLLDELEGVAAYAWRIDFKDGCRVTLFEKPASPMYDAVGATITPLYDHATIADLAKRCEAAERDARRYRWLRDKAWSMPAIAQQELPAVAIFSGSGRRCKDVSGEEMDAAIDATQEGEG